MNDDNSQSVRCMALFPNVAVLYVGYVLVENISVNITCCLGSYTEYVTWYGGVGRHDEATQSGHRVCHTVGITRLV